MKLINWTEWINIFFCVYALLIIENRSEKDLWNIQCKMCVHKLMSILKYSTLDHNMQSSLYSSSSFFSRSPRRVPLILLCAKELRLYNIHDMLLTFPIVIKVISEYHFTRAIDGYVRFVALCALCFSAVVYPECCRLPPTPPPSPLLDSLEMCPNQLLYDNSLLLWYTYIPSIKDKRKRLKGNWKTTGDIVGIEIILWLQHKMKVISFPFFGTADTCNLRPTAEIWHISWNIQCIS